MNKYCMECIYMCLVYKLTTVFFVNLVIYTILLSPSGVSPPYNIALLSETLLNVKLEHGGGG